MKISLNYIYIQFTTFTLALFNILFACKYCKCNETAVKPVFYNLLSVKYQKSHIYIYSSSKYLTINTLQKVIYNIYNIYRLKHTNQLTKKNWL